MRVAIKLREVVFVVSRNDGSLIDKTRFHPSDSLAQVFPFCSFHMANEREKHPREVKEKFFNNF